jgi:hypothetical protein
VALGFKEDGIHFYGWFNTSSFSLHHLSTTNLAATRCDPGVESHVLSFEWSNTPAVLSKDATKASDKRAFANG